MTPGLGLHGVTIQVVEPGTVIQGDDGTSLTCERGSAVAKGRDLWMVKEDFEALKQHVGTVQ